MLYARNVGGATQIDGSTYLLMHRATGFMRCSIQHPDAREPYCTYGDISIDADGDDVPLLALRPVNQAIWCAVMGIRRTGLQWTFRVVAIRAYNTGLASIANEDIQWWAIGRPFLTPSCSVLLRDRTTRRLLYTNAAPIARMTAMVPEYANVSVGSGTFATVYNGRLIYTEQSQTDEQGETLTYWTIALVVAGRTGSEVHVSERILNAGMSAGGNGAGTQWGSGGEQLEGWGSSSGALVLNVAGV